MNTRSFLIIIMIAGILNSLGMLIRFDLGVLIGLLTGLFALALFYNPQAGWSMKPLLASAVGISLITWVGLTIICQVSTTSVCQRNLFYLSSFPGLVIILSCLVLLLRR